MNALRLLHTVRYLRWQQVVFRPLRRLQRRLPPPTAAVAWRLAESWPALAAAVRARGLPDAAAALRRADEVRAGRFALVGATVQLDRVDWRTRPVNRLWTYHLHYFDYALDLAHAFLATHDAAYVRTFERLALDWIAQTDGGPGDGWDAYPIATRVPNWLLAMLLLDGAVDRQASAAILASAHRQLRHLERTLEYHLLANHLQRNLYALAVGGLCFAGDDAARWRGRRTDELWRQLDEQVLPDGGHYERSPMYHALALADFLTVIELREAAGEAVPAPVRQRVRALALALVPLARPDGSLHLLNDTAHGAAPAPDWLRARASRVLGATVPAPRGAWALPDTGYFGWRDDAAGERFIIDCGPIGPAYNAAHGHCDLLSFELDLFDRPFCVDAGVCGYDDDPLRAYVRSTAAHNTVLIDGREQSELWATFRVGRRAEPELASQHDAGGRYSFSGAYRPYHDRSARHARTVTRTAGSWLVSDQVTGARGRPLQSFLHLHPSCVVTAAGSEFVVEVAGRAVRVQPFGIDDVAWHPADAARHWHCPAFGTSLPAPALEFRVLANDEREFGYRIVPEVRR